MERALDDAGLGSSAEARLASRTALVDARQSSDSGAFSIACGLARDHEAKDQLLATLTRSRRPSSLWGTKPDQHFIPDPIEVARGYAAVGLGLMGDRTAIAPMHEVLKQFKYQSDLFKDVALALCSLGDESLVPELLDMLTSSKSIASQAAISLALGASGDARSVDPLISLLQNKEFTELGRSFAAVALGMIADKDDLPWNAKFAANVNYRASTPTLSDQSCGILDIP
jgi:HEAT repeat protein